jgi:tetratricopeptide (TPR) repeat protein
MNKALLVIIIIVSVFAVYSNTLDAPFQYDDTHYVTLNPSVKNSDVLFSNWNGSRFLVFFTFWVNHEIADFETWIYHLTNILIHIAASIVIFLLLELLLKTVSGDIHARYHTMAAFFGALLFGLHPINTEAVTYISQRSASLATMLYMLSVFFYIKGRVRGRELQFTPGKAEQRGRNPDVKATLFYAFSVLCAVFAMKSKENAFTLPFMIFFLEYALFRKVPRRPWHVLAIFTASLLIIPLSNIDAIWSFEMTAGKKTVITLDISRFQYFITQMRVLISYMRFLVLPVSQNVDHYYPLSESLFELRTFLALLVHLGLIGIAFLLIQRNTRAKFVGIGIIWYYVTLSVESTIIPINIIMCEYRLYLPFLGFLLVLLNLVLLLPLKKFTRATAAVGVFVLLISGFLAYERNLVWATPKSLWEDSLKKNPLGHAGHNNLGLAYAAEGLTDKALEHFETAVRLMPKNQVALVNLGLAYEKQGLSENAILLFEAAVRIDPLSAEAHFGLAQSLMSLQSYDKALYHMLEAIEIKPDFLKAHFNLGLIFLAKGLNEDAEREFSLVLEMDPDDLEARQFLDFILHSSSSH